MSGRLILAVPSKGRLQEQAQAYFGDAGLAMSKAAGARGYRATLAGMPDIDVMLVSAGEIADALLAGDAHLGVTGEDLVRETAPSLEGRIALLKPLGFGFADVVVAVPEAWIDVTAMADLDDVCAAFYQRHRRRLRVATKYVNLTRGFFARHGIWDYRIVESGGATEGAPAAGIAEAIVDITTTGATLAANNLKTLEDGTILKSQAQLAASLSAKWDARRLRREDLAGAAGRPRTRPRRFGAARAAERQTRYDAGRHRQARRQRGCRTLRRAMRAANIRCSAHARSSPRRSRSCAARARAGQ